MSGSTVKLKEGDSIVLFTQLRALCFVLADRASNCSIMKLIAPVLEGSDERIAAIAKPFQLDTQLEPSI